MAKIIMDCGTTNSRLRLATGDDDRFTDVVKIDAGIRNSAMDGNMNKLTSRLKEGIRTLVDRNHLTIEDIEYIAASGMITSNIGLYEVPHVKAPASLKDIAKHVKIVSLDDFFGIPCLFIPGMKSGGEDSSVDDLDVMRGEEVETFGLLDRSGPGLVVLPGSHTKFVFVNKDGQLTKSYTTLGGELLKAVQSQTILANSIEPSLIEAVEPDVLEQGYQAAEAYGVTRALFHVRLLHLQKEYTANERANYAAGAIFHEDMKALKNEVSRHEVNWIMVGGSRPLCDVFAYLLKKMGNDAEVFVVDSELAAFQGALKVIKTYTRRKSNENQRL